jgi:hypothetical protein
LVFTDNLLESLQGDIDIDSAVDINFNSDVDIQKDLVIRDNFGFGGSLNLLGNQPTDTVTFEVEFSQDFLPDKDLIHDLGTAQKVWARIWLTQIHADSVDIHNNYLSSNQSNSDLELKANGSGKIFIPENFTVKNNLAQTGSISVGNLNLNGISLLEDFTAATNFDTTGSVGISENITVLQDIDLENISIKENTISTTRSNEDLELRANQTGIIRIDVPSVLFENSLSVDSVQTFSNILLSEQVDFSKSKISNITIDGNVISTIDTNLNIYSNGTGDVVLQDFKFKNNRARVPNNNFVLAANRDFNIDSTGSVKIPVGLNGYTGEQSQFRFNIQDSVFEGYTSTARIGFGGVYSDDRKTSVITNPQNQIEFVTNTDFVGEIRSDAAEFSKIVVDDIDIDNNTITTTESNSSLEFQTNQSAGTVLYDTRIVDNKIQNVSTSNLTFSSVNLGYYKISSSNGVVVPYSNTTNRPASAEIGDTRWNTTTELLEVWNGTSYISAAGLEDTVTAAEFDDLITEYTLIFG